MAIATPTTSSKRARTPLRKDAMMAQNLRLLGFAAGSAPSSGASQAALELQPSMFDRPNEKLLFRVLHFLLLKLKPHAAQEFRFCWPITVPQDKSSFKKLAMLLELEKQCLLPPGSSQASRINTGCGPRVVDLIWRLSTLVMKAALLRDARPHAFVPLPASENVSGPDAVLATKAKIALKTHMLKRASVERCRVQDEWLAFASMLTAKIRDVTAMQERVHEEQSRLDASVDRDVYSHVGESVRTTKLEHLASAWTAINDVLSSPTYAKIQSILATTVQHSAEQPVLAASAMRSDPAAQARGEAVDLLDVVKNAEALVRMAQSRVQPGDGSSDATSLATPSLLESSRQQIAALHAMVQRLQALLAEVQEANDRSAREQYIHMAAASDASADPAPRSSDHRVSLCPLTPAQLLQQENHLVQSLKKVSMKELTALAAESVRRSNQRKERELLSASGAADGAVARTLDYNDTDDAMES